MKFYIFPITLILLSFNTLNDLQKKIVTDDNFTYEFFVDTDNLKNHSTKKEYFWYRNGAIISSFGQTNGDVLDGIYIKKYVSHQLATQGSFSKGLKNNTWMHWFENGQIKELIEWNHGYKSGKYESYNNKGAIELKGHYSNNKKSGKWISYISKDTLYYKKGNIVTKKESEVETNENNSPSKLKLFFNKLFNKEENTEEKVKKPSKLKAFFTKITTKKNNSSKKKVTKTNAKS